MKVFDQIFYSRKTSSLEFPTSLNEKNLHVYVHVQFTKVQVGNDQEKAQSEKDSHSKNRGGKKPN